MKSLKTLLKSIVIFVFSHSLLHAGVIVDNGTYTTIDGLDWLDLSLTDGLSITEALNTNDGYRLATESEYQSMLNNFYSYSAGESTFDGETVNWNIYYHLAYGESFKIDSGFFNNSFATLFGSTLDEKSSDNNLQAALGYYEGIFGANLGGVSVVDYLAVGTIDDLLLYHDYNRIFDYRANNGYNDAGIFLVRTSTLITEPSIFAIMCLGFMGVFWRYRYKIKIRQS